MSSAPNTDPISIPEALDRAHAHWNAGQVAEAEVYCQRVLAAFPGQADALHLLGLMAHAYGNLDLAIAQLRQACMAPRAPAIYFSNLAEMYRQKGMLVEGEEAAQRAVAMDPSLVPGWNNLGILLQEAGKLEQSLACLERVVALTPDAPEAHNNLANTYRRLDRLGQAEQHYRQALALNPHYAEAHSNLAFLLTAQGQYDQAAAEARLAIELNPRLIDAYLNLADVEVTRHRHAAALQVLDALQAFAPQHPAGLTARAKALTQLERLDAALACAQQAMTLAPRSAEARYALAQVLQALGKTDEALAHFERAAALAGTVREEALIGRATLLMESGQKDAARMAFDQALSIFPASIRVLTARAEVKTFHADDPDVGAIEAWLANEAQKPLNERISAHFALGKAYLDLHDAPRAFAHLHTANQRKRATFGYDAKATRQWMQRISEVFTAERMERLAAAGAQSDLPVFIIGMPRSGTTLVEQILSSHSQVMGAGELSALRQVVEGAGLFPDIAQVLTPEDAQRLGRTYLNRIEPLAQGRRRLIDKMPGNFIYAGLIPLILPGARIIHCRRNPVDTCLSCYTKQFSGEQPFSYDLAELGEFYTDYQKLMAHWPQVLPPDRFIEVDYERVVDDLEGEARRLVGFLGLPWEDACLRFHANERVVRTASVNQVRQPIYTTSKGRWQKYANHLGPLLAALGMSAP